MSELHPDEFQFHEYLDGELELAELTRFEQHVASCMACSQQLAELEALFEQVESLPEVLLELDLSPQVVARLERPLRPLPAVRWVAIFQSVAALILLAAVWPLLRSWFATQFDLSQLTAGWQFGWVDGWQQLGQQASAWGQMVSQWARQPWNWMSGHLEFSLPLLGLGLLMVAASLAWLVGNGLLLRGIGRKVLTQ